MEKFTIDAKNQKIGRVATEAAHYLLGKNEPNFKPNVVADVCVEIINASKLDISPKKSAEKVYTRYTGYPSGLRERTLDAVIEKKGYGEVVEKAVYGMLPGNKLRPLMMKNLVVTD